MLSKYDAIVGTPRNHVATPIDQPIRASISGLSRDILGAVGNVAGLPSIAVPNGFGARGLPTGIQFMGRAYEENSVLAAARAYQLPDGLAYAAPFCQLTRDALLTRSAHGDLVEPQNERGRNWQD